MRKIAVIMLLFVLAGSYANSQAAFLDMFKNKPATLNSPGTNVDMPMIITGAEIAKW